MTQALGLILLTDLLITEGLVMVSNFHSADLSLTAFLTLFVNVVEVFFIIFGRLEFWYTLIITLGDYCSNLC
jgi:hypothetical protein